jgi:pSer/pThr/pTyr-binding forkhead associated (FHA) protein
MSGKTIALDTEVTTIGSAPGSTVTLKDAGVSRKHAGIRRLTDGDSGYELADLGSTNGVYVNGEKVAKKKLQLGDVIRVGASEMVFK